MERHLEGALRLVSSSSQHCPSEESSTAYTLEKNWGISGASGAFLSWQLQEIHMGGVGWAEPFRRKCLGSLQVQGFDCCSVSFYLHSQRVGGGLQPLLPFPVSSGHLDTERLKYHHCDLPYELCTAGSKEHGRHGSTHTGESALSSSCRAALPVLGCTARWVYLRVLESLGCSWHLAFA